MSDTTFRITEGVPHVGDCAYPWAIETWDRRTEEAWYAEFSPAGFYEGFRLRMENAWEMQVIWTVGCPRDTDSDGQCGSRNCPCRDLNDLLPAGMKAIVDCIAVGLHESYGNTPEGETWPHGTPFNWSFPRLYLASQDRFEEVLVQTSTRPSPPWL